MRLFLLCAAYALAACDLDPGEVRTDDGPRGYVEEAEQHPDAEQDAQPSGRDAFAGVYDLAPAAADFFDYAAQFSLMEVEANRIALERAENGEVRALAAGLLAYHREALKALRTLGRKSGFDVPDALNVRRQAVIDDLTGETLGGFDSNYLQRQGEVYEEAADVYRAYAGKGGNDVMQSFAAEHANDIGDQWEKLRELQGV